MCFVNVSNTSLKYFNLEWHKLKDLKKRLKKIPFSCKHELLKTRQHTKLRQQRVKLLCLKCQHDWQNWGWLDYSFKSWDPHDFCLLFCVVQETKCILLTVISLLLWRICNKYISVLGYDSNAHIKMKITIIWMERMRLKNIETKSN